VTWATEINDIDNDLVPDHIEQSIGTNINNPDTDGDGLTDAQELSKTFTNPLKYATVTPGGSDLVADMDADGLSNQLELTIGTHPVDVDTDDDGLSDAIEYGTFNSDPLKADSDNDGLTDDSEQRLATQPRNPDSNGNGTHDGAEIFTTSVSMPNGAASVELTGMGDVAKTVTFQDVSANQRYQNIPGQVTSAIDIKAAVPFSRAVVKLQFNPAQVPNQDYANLRMMYFDERARVFKSLTNDGVDAATGYAWAETTHFTTFVLFHIPTWQTAWQVPLDGDNDPATPILLDMMLVIDSSGSMSVNDPQDMRKTAAKEFVDALLPGDQAGVIDFDTIGVVRQHLTMHFSWVKDAIDLIDADGGTNLGSGIGQSNNVLVQFARPATLKVAILLTDGQGPYNPVLTTQAHDAGIVIFTIGLGNDVDGPLLQAIADGTGGRYYAVASPEDLPEVFSRITEETSSDGDDTDQDGIPNLIETQGIRSGTGAVVITDPAKWDTDGDGLSDGDEAGERRYSPNGEYYTFTSNPTLPDTDDDGLTDLDELDLGTDSFAPDSDYDGLSDGFEATNSFDPLDPNPDSDSYNDSQEWTNHSDPFYYDLSGLDYIEALIAGLIWGSAGPHVVNIGLVDQESLESLAYPAGWLISGFIGFGDARDFLFALVDGNFTDALLSLVGIIPIAGDVAKSTRVIQTYVHWLPEIKGPVTKWVKDRFKRHYWNSSAIAFKKISIGVISMDVER